jgi:hypothetical protein
MGRSPANNHNTHMHYKRENLMASTNKPD